MEKITINTHKRFEVKDITEKIREMANEVESGFLMAFTLHTTAAITIQEHDTSLWEDLLRTYKKLVPVEGGYSHQPNAQAHILSSLIKPFVCVPISNGKLVLGTWQRILFLELDGGRKRKIHLQVISQ